MSKVLFCLFISMFYFSAYASSECEMALQSEEQVVKQIAELTIAIETATASDPQTMVLKNELRKILRQARVLKIDLSSLKSTLAELRGEEIAKVEKEDQRTERASNEEIDLQQYEIKYDFDGQADYVQLINFSKDGKKLLYGDGEVVNIVDLDSGELVTTLSGEHESTINFATFSPDGKSVVTASDDTSAVVWDVASGLVKHKFEPKIGYIRRLSFSPDGKRLILSSLQNSLLFDFQSKSLISDLGEELGLRKEAQYSPDGKYILGFDRTTIRVVDSQSFSLVREFIAPAESNAVLNIDDASRLLTWVGAEYEYPIVVWDIFSGNKVFEQESLEFVSQADSYDKIPTLFISGTDFILAKEVIQNPKGYYERSTHLIDYVNGKKITELTNKDGSVIGYASSSRSNQRLAVTSGSNTVEVLQITKDGYAKLFELKAHKTNITSIRFSPDDKYIITGGNYGRLIVWSQGVEDEK